MKRKLLLLCGLLSSWAAVAQLNSLGVRPSQPVSSTTLQTQAVAISPQFAGNSQHSCKSHELNEQHYQSRGILNEYNQSYLSVAENMHRMDVAKSGGSIPVIFHVVHNPNRPATNVSYATVVNLFNELVRDFSLQNPDRVNARTNLGFNPADVGISFCLATKTPTGTPLAEPGVIRVQTSENWYDSDNGEENKMKSASTGGSQIWNRNQYLNVWICDITNGANSGTAGYAYRPTTSYLPGSGIDGIVIDYNLGVNNEHVLSHEVGHYLGLDHTWGGSGGCSNDDGFADTPNTAGPSFNYAGSCGSSQSTCSAIQTQYENFMDYSNCTVMFTQAQANFMNTVLNGIRSSLLSSQGCASVQAAPVVSFTANIGEPIIIPVGGSVTFTDQSTNTPTSWAWNFGGGATNSTQQNPTITFNAVGTYSVTLNATNQYGTGTLTKNAYVQVVAAAQGASCDTLKNFNPAQTYQLSIPGGGYIAGTARYDASNIMNEWAESLTAPTSTQVRGIRFAASKKTGTNGTVTFKVYANNNGLPGTVLAQQTVPFSSIVVGNYLEVLFDTPPTVTGAFHIGYQLSTGAGDTLAMYTNYNNTGNPPNKVSLYVAGTLNLWAQLSEVFTNTNGSLFLAALTSNGNAPVLDVTSNLQACVGGTVTLNGANSQNVSSYEYYLTNSTGTTLINSATTANASFTMNTAGNYRIYAYGNGSCDYDEEILNFTVVAKPTATLTPTATTCNDDNGVITISNPTGGIATGYEYALNGGTFASAPLIFNQLPAGSHSIGIKTAGSGCTNTLSVNIGASTDFVPTISSNQSICVGGTATLTAAGGTTYVWYDGSTVVGNTASISVSPSSNTQYSCMVTNAQNCTAVVTTTVNVTTSLTIDAGDDQTVCSGTAITLNASGATGITWSNGSENGSSVTLPQGTHTLTASVTGQSCIESDEITIVVNATPTVNAGQNATICDDAMFTLNATGATTYTWSTGDENGSSISLPVGTHTLTVTGTANNCTATDDVVVDVEFCSSVDIINGQMVQVYPNPTTGICTVVVVHATVQVMDLNGKILSTHEVSEKKAIDMSDLATGVYILNIKTSQADRMVRVQKM